MRMRFSFARLTTDGASFSLLAVTIWALTLFTRLTLITSRSLGISGLSWALVFVHSLTSTAAGRSAVTDLRRRRCWAIGACFTFAGVCVRVTREGQAIWWIGALLPLSLSLAHTLSPDSQPTTSFDKVDTTEGRQSLPIGTRRYFAIFTICSLAVLLKPYLSPTSFVLGLCAVGLLTLAYNLLEASLVVREDQYTVSGGFVSANGSLSRKQSVSVSDNYYTSTVRDVSLVATVGLGIAALCMESMRTDSIIYDKRLERLERGNWKTGQWRALLVRGLLVAAVDAVHNTFSIAMVRKHGSLPLSLLHLSATLFANLVLSSTISAVYLTTLATGALYIFAVDKFSVASPGEFTRARVKQAISALSILSVLAYTVLYLRNLGAAKAQSPLNIFDGALHSDQPFDPIPVPDGSYLHPAHLLVNQAEAQLDTVKAGQSKSLAEAVIEYKRRYKIPPPPHFDMWYELAKSRNVQLIDEFDTVFDSILPFWGLPPATIRKRAQEALGFDNALIGFAIRDGEIRKIEGGEEWQQKATTGMMSEFIRWLPDMDLAFNIHDEPRVVVPHDDLDRLVKTAKDVSMRAARYNASPKNKFSSPPPDLNNGKAFVESQITRFNVFAHQPTWTNSRMSCPADSPARSLSETPTDNQTAYAMSPLGFIYNATAFSDVCYTPSLRATFGFFDRPNAFNVVHDLFPIFSQSKTSSFQDIIYPSPWYWSGKVTYEPEQDIPWSAKNTSLYWRGSTTGGFSRKGGWRRQHRQHLVATLNAHDSALIMTNTTSSSSWTPKTVPRDDYSPLIDVHFSHIGQCDPGDCDAQREAFSVAPPAEQHAAWHWKHLLDMDGNAFSGRFYAFLRSKSLVYKMALFREWHAEWLRPWVHYVPLSLKGSEILEVVRWFSDEGQEEAERLANGGREWAEKVLRKEDFEVWFFRLLLEYGRVVDDNRESIGYAGP